MKNKKFPKWIAPVALFMVVMFTVLFFLQKLLMPKYMSDIVEGALTAEYYEETTDHEVIFVGDCEVYENFSPITLYEGEAPSSFRGSLITCWRTLCVMRSPRWRFSMCWL